QLHRQRTDRRPFRAVHRTKGLELLERQITTADLRRLPTRHFPRELRQKLREPILLCHSHIIVWYKRLGSRQTASSRRQLVEQKKSRVGRDVLRFAAPSAGR